nr:MAG TPA: Cytochrome oxidase maturation protein cbb3-type [Caudoviricetes sp.]
MYIIGTLILFLAGVLVYRWGYYDGRADDHLDVIRNRDKQERVKRQRATRQRQ